MKFFSLPKTRSGRGRFERFNIVVAILVAGWVPSLLVLTIAYTALTNTLESKIIRDRQTFVRLIAHLVADDLGATRSIIEYYQTLPDLARIVQSPNAHATAQEWLSQAFFSHPRIDGMFITDAQGRLIASVPSSPDLVSQDFASELWQKGANSAPGAFVSRVHHRSADGRLATDIVGTIRSPEGQVLGYLGVSVLVERIGRRLSTIGFSDRSICQVVDQSGTALFNQNFEPNPKPFLPGQDPLRSELAQRPEGHFERGGNLYAYSAVEDTGWLTLVSQPRTVAYQPVQDLLGKITVPVAWLIVGTALAAWLAGRFYRRQQEATRRIEREVIFNEKILANMPSGIALVDPGTRKFLQANHAFAQIARRIGGLPEGRDLNEVTYGEVKIASEEAIEKVLLFGTPFQLVEQPFKDSDGQTRFLNVNLLRLQGSQQTIQGVLYLVEDKTRDVTLRQELIGANAAKDQFLALLSHELRNPLSPVLAMVSELEAQSPGNDHMRQALEVIRRNVELEARLIDDLLDVTRISRGKLQLTYEVVPVGEVLRRAYEICRADITAKNQHPEFRLRAERSHVEGDPARLQQVFWNLIKNSVKFTPEGGRIIIETFNPDSEEIEIKITDTGIGIPPDKIGKVFNAFEQGQSSITRRFGGLGLGLAISKAMVEAHGGTIEVSSDGKDKGATFTVRLKTVEKPSPVEKPATKLAPAASAPMRNGRKHRLLIVDDHQDTCLGMKMLLERRGYDITVAHSADQAVAKAEADAFDLIISDIGLPDRSGYELMQELRARKGLRGIALSGFGMEHDVSRARAAGFSEHLTKPINFERLEEVIQELIETDGEDKASKPPA